MIRGMFTTFGMEETRRDDYDIDAWLEHSEEELQESFLEFYYDVLPELRSVGTVVQFKVRWDQDSRWTYTVYPNYSQFTWVISFLYVILSPKNRRENLLSRLDFTAMYTCYQCIVILVVCYSQSNISLQ